MYDLIQKIFEAIGEGWGVALGIVGTTLGAVAASDKSAGIADRGNPDCDFSLSNCTNFVTTNDAMSRLGGWVPDWFVELGSVSGGALGGAAGAMAGALILHGVIKPNKQRRASL